MERELIQVNDSVRVENGPVRVTAVATKELLDNKETAKHYYTGIRKLSDGRKRRGIDAMGKPIMIGEEMTFLDYRHVWGYYVYQMQDVMLDEKGRITDDEEQAMRNDEDEIIIEHRYIQVGFDYDREKALEIAATIGGE